MPCRPALSSSGAHVAYAIAQFGGGEALDRGGTGGAAVTDLWGGAGVAAGAPAAGPGAVGGLTAGVGLVVSADA